MVKRQKHRFVRPGTWGVVGCLVGLAVALIVWRLSSTDADQYRRLLTRRNAAAGETLDRATEARVEAFCGDCHALPRPESLPRDAWHDGVVAGYTYYARSGRNDLDPPPMRAAVAYFRARAPEHLTFPEPVAAATKLGTRFVVEKLPFTPVNDIPPANSQLRWTRLDPNTAPVLLTCDLRYGSVAAIDLRKRPYQPQLLAQLNNPCHVEPCDLDGDQTLDLVVADAGTEYGLDHHLGRIVWLRRQPGTNRYESVVLASGLGRPADVRPADLDGDGDIDLLVADFGAFLTGKILLLRNAGITNGRPHFDSEVLDIRPGTVHLPIYDFNADGRLDFAALITQEYEYVDLFINQGGGHFHTERLWAAPDLTFGSSGIELTDLDQDGDMDILYTNGDVLVNDYANPSHGVQWLENQGNLQFAYHRIADLPGAYRALAGDVDLDGDLDIIAVAMFFQDLRPAKVAKAPFASIVCLEQTAPGKFAWHTLETGFPFHLALELADFDDDGDLDFATGAFSVQKRPIAYRLAIWWNQAVATGGGGE